MTGSGLSVQEERRTLRGGGPRRLPGGSRTWSPRAARSRPREPVAAHGDPPARHRAEPRARPTLRTQSSIRSATCSASCSSKLSRIRSPRANLSSCAVPTPTAMKAAAGMRPLTPLIAKIEPPSSTRQRCRLRPGSPSSPGSVKKTSTWPAGHPPDGFGVVERQGTVGGGLLGLAVGQELLDQEPGRQPVAVGRGPAPA